MSTDAVHHVSFREIDSVFAGWSEPATASISRPVSTADIGDERSPATGCSARVALICGRRSGEALRTSQSRTLAVTASEACDREIAAPPCAPGHSDALQFHCGKPPPAADRAQPYQHGLPRRLRRAQKAKRLLDLSASVRVDLQPHRDLDDDGCLPLHCCIPRSDSCRWQKPGFREEAADPTDMMIDLMDSGFAPVAAVLSFIADNGATPGSIR